MHSPCIHSPRTCLRASVPRQHSAQIRSWRSRRVPEAVADTTAESGEAKARKASPLQRGGSLTGEKAAGKDAGTSATSSVLQKQKVGPVISLKDGAFSDYRWQDGRWDLAYFTGINNKVDWDSVIDAEIERRKLLEETPVASLREDPVNFDTSEIPWWAWVRRFHLPEAEKLNGRAAMVGYALAWFVDSLSGYGLVDQQNSFLGKLLLHFAVFAILIFRNLDAIPSYKNLLDEATFYDKQWQATWAACLDSYGLVDQQNSFLGKLLLHFAVFAILIFRNLDAIPSYKNLLDEATFYDKQWQATWAGQERPVESEK